MLLLVLHGQQAKTKDNQFTMITQQILHFFAWFDYQIYCVLHFFPITNWKKHSQTEGQSNIHLSQV